MSKRIRSAILFFLVLVFVVTGFVAVLYAQGYRAQLKPFVVHKVGGIYTRVLPGDAELSVNGATVHPFIRIFERGTLVNNLFPGSYSVVVSKAGYHVWTATVPVEPSFVTSHPHIVLLPAEGEVVTTTPVTSLAPLGNNAVAFSENGGVSANGHLITGDNIIAASDNGRAIITRIKNDGYYFTDLDTATSTQIARAFPRFVAPLKGATFLKFVPQSDTQFIIQSSSSVRLADTVTGKTNLLAESSGGISATGLNSARIAWTVYDPQRNRSVLSLFDLLSNTRFADLDLAPGKTKDIIFEGRSAVLLLQEDGSLYSFALDAGTRTKLAENVLKVSLSDDGDGLALVTKDGIEALTPGESSRYTFLRIPQPEKITSITWQKDLYHLFLGYPDKVVFLDLGDSTLQNLVAIPQTSSFTYLEGPDALYTIASGTLLKFQLP